MAGKGDTPRPVDGDRYRRNYDAIFSPPYPAWICRPCGEAYGRGMPAGHIATWHMGTCGICGQDAQVTEPRDYKHLKKWPQKNLVRTANICQHLPTPDATPQHLEGAHER